MKRVCMVLLMFVLCFSNVLIVHADRSDVDSVITLDTGLSSVSSICSQANSVVGENILVYTGNDGLLSFSNKIYSGLDVDTKKEFMRVALGATRESGLSTQMKNKVYNFISSQDTSVTAAIKYLQSDASADFVAAKAWFKPFSGAFGTIMGVLCLLSFLFMGMSMVFDLAYLALPGVQMVLERGEDNKKPFGVSKEAWNANREVEKEGSSAHNIMVLYMKKRVPVIFLMSLCLGYVISGMIYDILIFIIDAFTNAGWR